MSLTTCLVDNRKATEDRAKKSHSSQGSNTIGYTRFCYYHNSNLLLADPSESTLAVVLPAASALQGTGLLCRGLKAFNSC